jgi:hypothetical protein
MRHSDRRVFSVQTRLVLGCAEKAQATQELAPKGSTLPSCVGLERSPTRAVASPAKAVIDRLPLQGSARHQEAALALPASTSATTGPMKRAALAAWGAPVAPIVDGRQEQGT